MPPYVRLVSIVISGKNENKVVNVAQEIARYLASSVTVWGPAPAPISLVNNMYRYRILLKVPKMSVIRSLLSSCREKYKKLPSVRVVIDVDPLNFVWALAAHPRHKREPWQRDMALVNRNTNPHVR